MLHLFLPNEICDLHTAETCLRLEPAAAGAYSKQTQLARGIQNKQTQGVVVHNCFFFLLFFYLATTPIRLTFLNSSRGLFFFRSFLFNPVPRPTGSRRRGEDGAPHFVMQEETGDHQSSGSGARNNGRTPASEAACFQESPSE